MDLTAIVNKLISDSLDKLNNAISNAIREYGIDPMGMVVSGRADAGSIDLGICTVSASANYSIKNLRGLNSLHINNITVGSIQGSIESFTSDINVSIQFKSNLIANVSGTAKAGCRSLHFSPEISGNLTANGIRAVGKGLLKGAGLITEGKASLQDIDVMTLNFTYNDVHASINGLGPLNSKLEIVTSIISNAFKAYITGALSGVIKDAVNHEINNILPYTIGIIN